MKNVKRVFVLLLALVLALPNIGFAQENEVADGNAEVADNNTEVTDGNTDGNTEENKEVTYYKGYAKFDQWVRDANGEKINILEKGICVFGIVEGQKVSIYNNGHKGYVFKNNLSDKPVEINVYTGPYSKIGINPNYKIEVYNETNGKTEYIEFGTQVTGHFESEMTTIFYFSYKGINYSAPFHNFSRKPIIFKGYIHTDLNVRDKNGKKIGVLLIGTEAYGESTPNENLISFNFKGQTGYIHKSYLKKDYPVVSGYTKFTQNVRDKNNNIIRVLRKNEYVEAGIIKGKKVYLDRLGGYIYRVNLSSKPMPETGYSKVDQWVRDAYGSRLGILKKGTYINGSLEKNGKIKFRYNKEDGYIYKNNLSEYPVRIRGFVSKTLNVRDKNGNKLGIIPIGEVINGKTDKYRVAFNFNGKTGYIHSSYLTDKKPVIKKPAVKPTNVKAYAKFTQNVRDKNNNIIGVVSKNTYISGIKVGQKIEIKLNGKIGYVWIVNLIDKPISSGYIQGNIESMIYHMPGQRFYNRINEENLIYFNSEEEAIRAGFRRSRV